MKPLDTKVAIVTGAGQGIGRGVSLALASAGAKIVLFGRTLEKLNRVKSELEYRGSEGVCVEGDVLNHDDIKRCVASAIDTFGGVNILVNNAQVISLGTVLEFDETQYQQGMDSGPLATVRFMRACYPYLKETSNAN